jgi:hypothetical protein
MNRQEVREKIDEYARRWGVTPFWSSPCFYANAKIDADGYVPGVIAVSPIMGAACDIRRGAYLVPSNLSPFVALHELTHVLLSPHLGHPSMHDEDEEMAAFELSSVAYLKLQISDWMRWRSSTAGKVSVLGGPKVSSGVYSYCLAMRKSLRQRLSELNLFTARTYYGDEPTFAKFQPRKGA